MRHLNLKRRLADEAGFVLATAVIVLLIVTVLVGAAITVATQTSTSTTRDDNTKAALEAAEAGLGVATFRLTKLEPGPTQCITGTATATAESNGYCKGSAKEPLGNGAEFTYWTAPESTACTGPSATPPAGSEGAQHCVTSVGTVNGVQRRVQERVFSLLSAPLFEVEGILGYTSILVKPGGKLEGELGTNGTLTLLENVTATKCDVTLPSGKIEASASAKCLSTTTEPSPYVRPSIPIGESAKSAATQTACKPPTETGKIAAGPNCDWLITNGIKKETPGDLVGGPGGSVKFEPSIRSLSIGNKGELTLKEGIYNFCDFQITGTFAKLTIENGSRVEIFIDSKERSESGCGGDAEAGKLRFKNGVTIENVTQNATYLQIYVYDGSGGTIEFAPNSSSKFYGTIVAPYSKLEIKNNAEFIGAIEVNEVELINNMMFKWDSRAKELKKEEKPHYERRTWEECPPTYAGTNFQEGC